MKNYKKGFTLIELLVVIAVVGILSAIIVATLSSSKEKANVATTKRALSSIKGGIGLCCSSGGALRQTADGAGGTSLCNPDISGLNLPTADSLKATSVGYDTPDATYGCSATIPRYRISITGHPKSNCNRSTGGYWIVSDSAVTPPTGC